MDDHDITVYGYANNSSGRPRKPLVHVIGYEGSTVASIHFHPDDAPAIADAILKAGRSAKAGRTPKPRTIALKKCD